MRQPTPIASPWLAVLLVAAVGAACGGPVESTAAASPQEPEPEEVKLAEGFTTFMALADTPLNSLPKAEAWRQEVPEVREVTITSTADGSEQPALFYDSGSDRDKPLLVVLHSWTADYRKQFSIPYGVWAVNNDWVMIHPEYRGRFNRPEATLSELAVQDVVDAYWWATEHAHIDEDRIYLTGFSGGAMAALTMVGRYPELWTAAAAWVPVYDLVDWYATIKEHTDLHYARNIVASCGGKPVAGTEAEEECRRRSPSSYLENARHAGVEVLIATGVDDWFVPPRHALRAYNVLAEPEDRLTEAQIEAISADATIPDDFSGEFSNPLIEDAGKELLLAKESDDVVLWIFDGSHDVIYNAGLEWLSRQRGTGS